jgi:BirA family biotin operon repressor/biotin-[acetyl-CoA-carboxylase] ligase
VNELSDWADYLEAQLGEARRVEVYRTTASTQDLAKARAAQPLLIVADHQTAGRGRLGRSWDAPAGSAALFSLTHRLDPRRGTLDRVAFLSALGVARAIERLARGLRVGIKWPNDLVIQGRKLAGILVETVGSHAVIGVGINVALWREEVSAMPGELRDRVTSLALLGHPLSRVTLIAEAVKQIDACLAAADVTPLVAEWRDRSVLSHQRLTLRNAGQEITGSVVDLDPEAGLIVRRDSGELITLPAGTTTVVG